MENPEIIDLVSSSEDDEPAQHPCGTEPAAERENAELGSTAPEALNASQDLMQESSILSGQNEDEDSLMSDGGDSETSSEEEDDEQAAWGGAQKWRGRDIAATAGTASADAFPYHVTKEDSGGPAMYLRVDLSSFLLLKLGRQEMLTEGKIEVDLTLGSSDDATVMPTFLAPHAGSNYAGLRLLKWRNASNTLHISKGDTAVFSYRGLINGKHNFLVEKQAAAAAPSPAAALGHALQRPPPQMQVAGSPPQADGTPIFSLSPSETAKAKKRRRADAAAAEEKLFDEEEERGLGPAALKSPHGAPTPGAGPSSAPFAWGNAGMYDSQRRRVAPPAEAIEWSDEIETPSAGVETVFEMEVWQSEYPGGRMYLNSAVFPKLLLATMGLQPVQLGKRVIPVELQLGEVKVLADCEMTRERDLGNNASGRLTGWYEMRSSLGLVKGDILRFTFLGCKTATAPSTKKKVVLRVLKQANVANPQDGQQQETASQGQQGQQLRPTPPDAELPTPGVIESSVWQLFEAMLPELVVEAQNELAAEGYTQDAADAAAIEASLRERFLEKEMVELMEELPR